MVTSRDGKIMPAVWVVDDDASIRWVLERALDCDLFRLEIFSSPLDVIKRMKLEPPQVLISDIRMPEMDGLTLLEAVHDIDAKVAVILMTAQADMDAAVSAYQTKAFEYLPKPFDVDEVSSLVHRALRQRLSKRSQHSTKTTSAEPGQDLQIIGQAPSMQEVFRMIGRVATLDVRVLITGETGTGKEMVAHALHRLSARHNQPFVAINTAAIPSELLESELFGHERGAFTGAHQQEKGRFEQAHGGTLFLDEIGDMPLALQTRLLRVLNDGCFYRVGGRDPIRVDVRILAATHRDMDALVADGLFREDLLYRLNVFRIRIPPLRERSVDIPILLAHWLQQESVQLKLPNKTVSQPVLNYLSQLPWPGNIRQLRSLCTWLLVMAPSDVVTMDDLPLEYQADGDVLMAGESELWQVYLQQWVLKALVEKEDQLQPRVEAEVDRILLETTLGFTNGSRSKTADILGWGRNTVTRKLKLLNLEHL